MRCSAMRATRTRPCSFFFKSDAPKLVKMRFKAGEGHIVYGMAIWNKVRIKHFSIALRAV